MNDPIPVCPICGGPLTASTDMMDNILMERHEQCPRCEYQYDFVTGATRVSLSFTWSYLSTPGDVAMADLARDALARLKQLYQQHHMEVTL